MYKFFLIILGVLFLSACSQKEPEVKVKTAVKAPVKDAVSNELPVDFVPEHIKRSKIEVVKHY